MAGRKFGTTGSEELTWAMNTLVPANVGNHFRIVDFFAGSNPLRAIGQGCREAIANQTSFSITQMNYLDIAGKLDRGLQTLNPAIEVLESLTEN